MKSKLIFIIIGVVLVYITYILIDSGIRKSIIDNNTTQTIDKIRNIKSDIVKISEVTDFEWDEAYSFHPYTPRKYQEMAMGKQRGVDFYTPNEPDTCLAFLNDGKVVCYIAGSTEMLGCYIVYINPNQTGYYNVFQKSDDFSFKVKDKVDYFYISIE